MGRQPRPVPEAQHVEATGLRVLHVWDQGIDALLAAHMDRICGTRSSAIHNAEFDPYGMTPQEWKRDYSGKLGSIRFKAEVAAAAIRSDVVHVHSLDTFVPMLYGLGCRVVLHYHGSDIRGKWIERERYWRHAGAILVSTRDLLLGAPEKARYQPNPIDTALFSPAWDMDTGSTNALYVDYGAADIAQRISEWHRLPLHIEPKGTPYREMPKLLNRYMYLVDVKRDYTDRVLVSRPTDTGSLIGLQALACGLTVLTLAGPRVGLPAEHQPENVAKSVYGVYKEVTEK